MEYLSPYNVILGRNRLHNMGTTSPSTKHQLLHYPALIKIYKRHNVRKGREVEESTSRKRAPTTERQVPHKHLQITQTRTIQTTCCLIPFHLECMTPDETRSSYEIVVVVKTHIDVVQHPESLNTQVGFIPLI